ncbi:MAG: 4Fe-4S binding protein [Methanotrichaceae archaeon]|nr:4Fe-4S binding protein [Methanotrichaceae archaeon]
MKLEKEMDVEGSHIRSIQRSEESTKILDYDYKRCNGCGICVDLCPTKALQKGPLIEIATGLDAPPVLIDLDECVFCGMCANFCPVKAYRFTVNDEDIQEDLNYPRLLLGAKPNEKCLPCSLCEPVCPTEAITVLFNKTREDLGPLREGIEGRIEVDGEKCNLCGICSSFCKAFVMMEKEKRDPREIVPFDQLLVDEDLCDYCGLCVGICPEEAISVEGPPLDAVLDLHGDILVDSDLCMGCGRCALVCPYEAIDVVKPFEGKIDLLEERLPECDPLGCHGCFNVCPSGCWYQREDGKVGVVEEQCIFCGACANACHCLAIDVERQEVSHTAVMETPWAEEWKEAIRSIVKGVRRRPDLSGAIEPPKIEKTPIPKVKAPERDPSMLKLVGERLDLLLPVMKKPKVRFIWERDSPEEAAEKIVDRAKIARPEAGAKEG